MKDRLRKFLYFIIGGGTAAFTNLVLFFVFINYLNIWYLFSSITSFILSVFVGFYLQKYLTFEDTSKEKTKRQMILFFLVSAVNLGINILLMLFFVEVLKFDKMLAKVCTLAILACWNFFVYEKFVFKKQYQLNILSKHFSMNVV